LDLQLPVQLVPITTNIVSLNPAQARCTTLCDKFVSDLWQVCGFLQFPPPVKLTATIYRKNIVESGIKHHESTNQLEIKYAPSCYFPN